MPPICAICQGTNNTTRLCGPCRADPANAGWSERDEADPTDDCDLHIAFGGLAALWGTRLRNVPDAVRDVLAAATFERITVTRANRGRGRRRKPRITTTRALSSPQIAERTGVPERTVRFILAKYAK